MPHLPATTVSTDAAGIANQSRRKFITGAAVAASAAAMPPPSIAASGETPSTYDPFLLAYGIWSAAESEYLAAVEVEEGIIDRIGADASRSVPRVEYYTRWSNRTGEQIPFYLYSHVEIDRICNARAERVDDIEPERARLHSGLEADEAWLRQEWERSGLAVATARTKDTLAREQRLRRDVFGTPPTTATGLLTFVRAVREELNLGPELMELIFSTLETAAGNFEAPPQQGTGRQAATASDAQDAAVFGAIERCLAAENEIDRLTNACAEDNDSPPLQRAFDESVEAREALADVAPMTLAGLTALAGFLNHQSNAVLKRPFFEDGEHLRFFANLERSTRLISETRRRAAF